MPRRSSFLLILLCATLAPAQLKPIALKGTVVTPDQIIPNGEVVVQNGIILEVGAQITIPPDAIVVDTGGVIAPGFIDLHNHLTWNVLPRWQPKERFGIRYDWQQLPDYTRLLAAPHKALLDLGVECDAERYAEVKAILEGETSVTGGSSDYWCDRGLARNLDMDPDVGLHHRERVIYSVFPLRMTPADIDQAKIVLHRGGSLLIHVSEGASGNAQAAQEFAEVKKLGFLVSGTSLIHGVALGPADFAEMHAAGVGLIWSPRSNIDLYGGTADIGAALRNHVAIALAPDWSPTGSDGMLDELHYAARWNESQRERLLDDHALFDMATVSAARLVHMDGYLGKIAPGYLADLIVVQPRDTPHGKDAWWTLDHASPQQLELVLIGGLPTYGSTTIMDLLDPTLTPEDLDFCGGNSRMSFASEPRIKGWHQFKMTEFTLKFALEHSGVELAPLPGCAGGIPSLPPLLH
ncbi:MAG: amidohydrolase family protein [Acidobacteriaceae bacterium]